MTSILDSSPTRQKTGKTLPRETSAPAVRAEQAKPVSKITVRTLLVASCGWPTEATVPERKKTARR